MSNLSVKFQVLAELHRLYEENAGHVRAKVIFSLPGYHDARQEDKMFDFHFREYVYLGMNYEIHTEQKEYFKVVKGDD